MSENEQTNRKSDVEIENLPTVELKIIEDEDVREKENEANVTVIKETKANGDVLLNNHNVILHIEEIDKNEETNNKVVNRNQKVENTENNTFAKVDIRKYRRNSSCTEEDVRLRRDLKDFTPLTNRSKSLTNTSKTNNNYVTYDINLNTGHLDHDASDTNGNPQKVVCKLYDKTPCKQSIDTISSTDKEFIEIDKATQELEREIHKLNMALHQEDTKIASNRISVSEISKKFDNIKPHSPNPIPKPRRTHSTNSPTMEV